MTELSSDAIAEVDALRSSSGVLGHIRDDAEMRRIGILPELEGTDDEIAIKSAIESAADNLTDINGDVNVTPTSAKAENGLMMQLKQH